MLSEQECAELGIVKVPLKDAIWGEDQGWHRRPIIAYLIETPEKGIIYVGSTVRGIRARLIEHYFKSATALTAEMICGDVRAWTVYIIPQEREVYARRCEQAWIEYLREKGVRLLNQRNGTARPFVETRKKREREQRKVLYERRRQWRQERQRAENRERDAVIAQALSVAYDNRPEWI